uniref:Nucleic-acid-binding protein from mobile element jockey n=1 Tax=Bactrocera dorsalis TaxID=27457 RepID=A0A034V434_BACDO
MAPGPPNINANRFALLDTGPKRKKNKIDSSALQTDFPFLPETKVNDPKFVVIESTDPSKPISSYSCFAIHRGIKQISSEVHSISTLRDGKLLILVKSNKIAEKFIKAKQLENVCSISAKLHESLNYVKGTVFAPFLNNVAEEEIVKELSSQGVVAAYKFKKTFDGNLHPSGVVLLTFNLYHLPSKIDIAWCKVLVRQYIPLPMRCKSCQLLGHTKNYCKRSPLCANCSLPPHSPSDCERTFCANCAQPHPSSSKECPKFLQSKEIIKIKTIDKCSMGEAIKKHKQQLNITNSPSYSYAGIASSANTSKTNIIITAATTNNKSSPTYAQSIKNSNNINHKNYEEATIDTSIEISNSSSNQIAPIEQINYSDSHIVKSNKTAKENDNIPTTQNTNKHNLTFNSPTSEFQLTDRIETDTNYNRNHFSSSKPHSSSPKSQPLFQPLPSLAQVLAATINQNTSDNEME